MKKRPVDLRLVLSLLGLVLLAGAIALIAVGSSASPKKQTAATKQSSFAASGTLNPVSAAPPLALHDYLGRPVNIDFYKGKVLLVTFLYTHCPDVCPLIASNLRVAQNLMPATVRSKVQMIAVSVDPKGDTPKAVGAFLAHHQLTGRIEYLVGSAHELGPVWQAWGVGSERDAQKPEFINHSGLIYGVTASGKRLTIYAANFQPSDVAHDVPLLAVR
ncbi:MAG TPA: SCO family protein [Solirubrobacteraceae bacterium]|nr:SCO family protein [Solirubrobacteraceae bacterium]